jgi:hypothetical protein
MKYQVITQHVKWLGLEVGDIVEYDGRAVRIPNGNMLTKDLIEMNLGWFRKVQEKDYTKDDLISFADFYYKSQGTFEFWGKNLFKEWLNTRKS